MKINPIGAIKNSLENVVANLGTPKDKSSYNRFVARKYPPQVLDAMYSDDWLTGKVVDIPVNDATRKWRTFQSEIDPEQIRKVVRAEKALGVRKNVNSCWKWARLYGGSLVLMGLDGTGELNEPLDVNRVREGSLKYLRVIDRNFVTPGAVNMRDPQQVNYMRPDSYKLTSGLGEIHSSRILRFDGLDSPVSIRQNDEYWGLSVVHRVYDAIVNAASVVSSSASLVFESKVDVISVEGLGDMLATPQGEDLLIKRFQIADMLKSINNILLLDKNETIDRKTYSFQGLQDILVQFLSIASSASDIPATRLLGQSASGLNATGEGDLDNYYDMVQSGQEDILEPELVKLDEVLVRSAIGYYPPDWSFEFVPLKQMSELDESTIRVNNATAASIYVQNQIVPPWVVTEKLIEQNEYTGLNSELVEILKDIENEPPPTDDEARGLTDTEGAPGTPETPETPETDEGDL